MKKYLIKQQSFIKKASKKSITLKQFISNSGLLYMYNVRLLRNVPTFSIIRESQFDSYSIYDGSDFDDSFELFCELMIVLKGLSYAESFAKTKQLAYDNANKLIEDSQDNSIKMKPLFLGDSDFAVC